MVMSREDKAKAKASRERVAKSKPAAKDLIARGKVGRPPSTEPRPRKRRDASVTPIANEETMTEKIAKVRQLLARRG